MTIRVAVVRHEDLEEGVVAALLGDFITYLGEHFIQATHSSVTKFIHDRSTEGDKEPGEETSKAVSKVYPNTEHDGHAHIWHRIYLDDTSQRHFLRCPRCGTTQGEREGSKP